MASTWMFAGPMGVGKYSTAVALAKTSMCQSPRRFSNQHDGRLFFPLLEPSFQLTDACGVCASCRAMDAKAHPDLHSISRKLARFHDRSGKSKATTLGIDVIRGEITGNASPENRVESKLYTRSQLGRGKWFIIDEADLMQIAAQNALLKALEEPPSQTYIVLITASPLDLLSTIRSRSQLVEFRSLPLAVLVPPLMARGLNEVQARQLARLSEGSLGRAMQWLSAEVEVESGDEEESRPTGKKTAKAAKPNVLQGDGPPVLRWIGSLGMVLDKLSSRQAGGMALADVLSQCAEQYAKMGLKLDPLASRDRLVRDGVMTMLGFVADWLDDRLRNAVGCKIAAPVPSAQRGLDPAVVQQCLGICHLAERQVDQNAHVALLLASTGTALEQALEKR